MKVELYTLPVSGFTVRDIGEFRPHIRASGVIKCVTEDLLDNTKVKGFPIVSNDERRLLMGYIGKTELRYVIDKTKRQHNVSPETPCLFVSDTDDGDELEFSGMASGPGVGMDDDVSLEIIENTARPDELKLWPWVNQVRVGASLHLSETSDNCVDTAHGVSSASARNCHAAVQANGVSSKCR